MVTELLVDNRIDDGRMLLDELVRVGFDVTVAFWVRTHEEGLWTLYIGSTSVESEKIGEAYRVVYACLNQIPNSSVGLSDVKLVHASNPIARHAIGMRDHYPNTEQVRYYGTRFGNLSVEEAYIYSTYFTVDAVTRIELSNGQLQVEKIKVSFPKQGAAPQPAEWVSGVKIVDNQLLVEKVQITRGPGGLTAQYRTESPLPVPEHS